MKDESWWVKFEYSQYTIMELLNFISNRKKYLSSHVDRCERELRIRAEQCKL